MGTLSVFESYWTDFLGVVFVMTTGDILIREVLSCTDVASGISQCPVIEGIRKKIAGVFLKP